jgi:hypothetical protein
MPTYLVSWSINVDAETPEDAALQARAMQTDPHSVATWFEVMGESAARTVAEACNVAIAEARLESDHHLIDTERLPKAQPCPNCQDRPGKDGLGRMCKTCGGTGYVKP